MEIVKVIRMFELFEKNNEKNENENKNENKNEKEKEIPSYLLAFRCCLPVKCWFRFSSPVQELLHSLQW